MITLTEKRSKWLMFFIQKEVKKGIGEKAQLLRVLTTLVGDLTWVPNTHTRTVYDAISRRSDALF